MSDVTALTVAVLAVVAHVAIMLACVVYERRHLGRN